MPSTISTTTIMAVVTRGYHNDGEALAAVAIGAAAVMAIGSMASAAQVQSQAQSAGCTMTNVEVNGVTYAQCGSNWYQPVYNNGQLAYQVVSPPQ